MSNDVGYFIIRVDFYDVLYSVKYNVVVGLYKIISSKAQRTLSPGFSDFMG